MFPIQKKQAITRISAYGNTFLKIKTNLDKDKKETFGMGIVKKGMFSQRFKISC